MHVVAADGGYYHRYDERGADHHASTKLMSRFLSKLHANPGLIYNSLYFEGKYIFINVI